MKHDWTKLTNGWVRHREGAYARIQKREFSVYDDGDVIDDTVDASPERTLELLTEAVAQRKRCEIREPRFAFGDWVNGAVGKGARVVKVEFDEVSQDHMYALLTPEDDLRWLYEGRLEPCDQPEQP